ncbi:hypothetical protein SEA_SHARKBOY_52 [Microbacterium phage Sharkboy]|uniref:Uncharacterized protein n=3 Tax=Dismasvirus dismas TaxID=2560588 RepID=A0A516KUC4_9CAUD|nr:hypothetical protein FDJ24_gp52 [Microbacterium phage Dismas]AVR57212.1 hypothetical protein PBI_KIERAN_51 [Microbacterium phage Kieran]QDP45288.1 hypothetical protein SEA_SHARKBOY_52 [Microbacterium phage Sharkboy]UYL86839.1 hypothetical protein SEA_RONA_51 [Microbacterium phage Rona]WNM67372.1 hypothetical protein SEA_CHILIPEPPER_51 [Microbacterium phage ChiliPepper]AUG84849.1 hypothetical protein PBI_DISMAS_52 [Microbacterium phage Dismas]
MTGQATVELGRRIVRARAAANEAAVVAGPNSYIARKALQAYRDLRETARFLFR